MSEATPTKTAKPQAISIILLIVAIFLLSYLIIGWIASSVAIQASPRLSETFEIAAQIGDRFGAVNSLFAGVALLLIGYSLMQTNKSIRKTEESLQMQSRELRDQNESWVLITYLSVLDRLCESDNPVDRKVANTQIPILRKYLKEKVPDHLELPEIDEEMSALINEIDKLDLLIAKLADPSRLIEMDGKLVFDSLCIIDEVGFLNSGYEPTDVSIDFYDSSQPAFDWLHDREQCFLSDSREYFSTDELAPIIQNLGAYQYELYRHISRVEQRNN